MTGRALGSVDEAVDGRWEMGHEMPARPVVADGAVAVDFPWAEAEAAVAALDAAVAELQVQADGHPQLRTEIGDWEGAYRDEHDDAYYRLTTRLWGVMGGLSFRAGAIVSAAEEAVEQQWRNNNAAYELQPGPN